MKKNVAFWLLISVLLAYGCSESGQNQVSGSATSDLQETACNAAHRNGECSRLGSLKLASVEVCCSEYGKCCP